MYSIEEQSRLELHKHIKKRPVVTKTICACCKKEIILGMVWSIKRFTQEKDKIGTWNYCTNCAPDKDDIIIEIVRDSYPFGIFPIDKNKHMAYTAFSWVMSDVISETNYKPKVRKLNKK